MEELREVQGKWRLIGRELGVMVDDIMYHDPTDSLKEMLSRWLNRKAAPGFVFVGAATWGHIIVALREANEPQAADHLKAKYIPGELTTR